MHALVQCMRYGDVNQPMEAVRGLLKQRIDTAWAAAAVQQGVAAAKAGERLLA